ncbi:hypothetical protein MKX01_018226 [Papaver californicum]|nr:hypothetical protein MKX01_018226 [Papaver californicum]
MASSPPTLHQRFGRKGIKFTDSVSLRIPDGLVTPYKPKIDLKDDGFEELVYTVPGPGGDLDSIKGGVGLVLNDVLDVNLKLVWSVELSFTSGILEISYIVSVYPIAWQQQ